MATFFMEYRPTRYQRSRHKPWVILMDAHPKPLVVGRCETEDQGYTALSMVAKPTDTIRRPEPAA